MDPFAPQGFGLYQAPNDTWLPTPLIRFMGEAQLRNPVTGAVYQTDAEAETAVGGHSVTLFANADAWAVRRARYQGDALAALSPRSLSADPQLLPAPAPLPPVPAGHDSGDGIFDKIAEATGFSKGTVQIGAVVIGIGALVYFGSGK